MTHKNELTVTIETITPQIAEQWLSKNTHNRNVKDKAVKRYADDMAAGQWDVNGETFKFNGDGRLLDGQNRLHAVIQAGVSIQGVVVRGLPKEAQQTIDVGVPRKLADVLKLRGEVSTIDLSSSLTQLWRYERDPKGMSETVYPSVHAALDVLDRNPAIRQSINAAEAIRKSIGLRASVGAPLHYITTSIDADDAEAFWERLHVGAGLGSGDPILLLRNVVLADRAHRDRKMTSTRLWALTVKAWNAYREGRPLSLLKWRPGGANPEAFPVPS